MAKAISWRDKFKRLFSWLALPGWLVGLWQPIEWLLGKLSDFDTLRSHETFMKLGLLAALSFITSPWGYLVSIVAGFAWLTFVIVRTPSTKHEATPSGGALFSPTVILGPAPQIFVSHIEVTFESLNSEGNILFNIGVVACANLELERLAVGTISLKSIALSSDAKASEIKLITLDTPGVFQITPQSRLTTPPPPGPTFPLYRGVSVIILKQHLAPIVQTYIGMALASKKQSLEFIFTGLALNVLIPEIGSSRLPLWDGVSCRPGIAFERVLAFVDQSRSTPTAKI